MAENILRGSVKAWRALSEVAGLDSDDRDKDLLGLLMVQLDPASPDLESALGNAPLDQFLQALFLTVQPFVAMFRDVLNFFERAGARYGRAQLKISVRDEFVDFRHFEEFIEQWNEIHCEFDIPALDRANAFILNTVRHEIGGYDYLLDGNAWERPIVTGFPDVDHWLEEYFHGRYGAMPISLSPDRFPPGLDDASSIVIAALSVVADLGKNRDTMIEEHRERSYRSIDSDALHPWTIAQSETDYWLRSEVMYLANLLKKPETERVLFGKKLEAEYARFPRRRFKATVAFSDFERLLSLPAWKKRYELYGVWVAAQMIDAIDDHDIKFFHDEGTMRFAFSESRIVDINSSEPRLSLIAERRSPLSDPIGKGRTASVQPDYGLWTNGVRNPTCRLVIEVKHYKKCSRKNFRDAVIDYGRAHQNAKVLLVNYGPAGSEFSDLPGELGNRCELLGHFTPMSPAALSTFRAVVRECVGEPYQLATERVGPPITELIAIDASGSMANIFNSDWFWTFIEAFPEALEFVLVDEKIRDRVTGGAFRKWLNRNELGGTSLADPIRQLIAEHGAVVVVTDQGGFESLQDAYPALKLLEHSVPDGVRLIRIAT